MKELAEESSDDSDLSDIDILSAGESEYTNIKQKIMIVAKKMLSLKKIYEI